VRLTREAGDRWAVDCHDLVRGRSQLVAVQIFDTEDEAKAYAVNNSEVDLLGRPVIRPAYPDEKSWA
jgi:hypothetical protein